MLFWCISVDLDLIILFVIIKGDMDVILIVIMIINVFYLILGFYCWNIKIVCLKKMKDVMMLLKRNFVSYLEYLFCYVLLNNIVF